MKILKNAIFILCLTSLTMVNAQESEKKISPKLKRKFMKMDKDKSGFVDLDEMKSYYLGKTKPNGKSYYPVSRFLGTDKDDDGKITISEFRTGVNWELVKKRKNKK